MSEITLPATIRDPKVKAKSLRQQKKITAEYYGAGKENLHLTLDYQAFRKTYKEAGGSTIINLKVGDEDKPREVLVHQIDYDPLTDKFQHVDFLQVDMQKKVTTRVPIHFEGVSPAVKTLGGILTHNKTELPIRCLPGDLIHEIVVDVAKLENIHDSIHIKDLQINREKIEVLEPGEVIVCAVMAPKTQEEIDAELAEPTGEAVSEEVKAEAEAEKAAAVASKESDSEKKGGEKKEEK